MATEAEVLQSLNSLEKACYIALITQAQGLFKGRQVAFNILNNFMAEQYNRTNALYGLILTSCQSDSMQDNYTIFEDVLTRISGYDNTLDQTNGFIKQTIYGDVQLQRTLQRNIAELNIRTAVIVPKITESILDFTTKTNTILSELGQNS